MGEEVKNIFISQRENKVADIFTFAFRVFQLFPSAD